MGFYVDPDAVERAAVRVSTLGGYCDLARTYNERNLVAPASAAGRLVNDFLGTMTDVQSAIEQVLVHLRNMTASTAAELFATRDYYRATDAAEAAAMDATLARIGQHGGDGTSMRPARRPRGPVWAPSSVVWAR